MFWFVLWLAGIVATQVGIVASANQLGSQSGAIVFKGPEAALILPPAFAVALAIAGPVGVSAGLIGIWHTRWSRLHRLAFFSLAFASIVLLSAELLWLLALAQGGGSFS